MNYTMKSTVVVTVLLLLLLAVSAHSMGFTNIFGHVHHKCDEVSERINEFLEEEESGPEHLAFFPRGIRTVKEVSNTFPRKRNAPRNKRITQSYESADEEMLERLIELQD
jgi:hypothetical protein